MTDEMPETLRSIERERRYIRWVLSPGLRTPLYSHLQDGEKRLRPTDFWVDGHKALWEAVDSAFTSEGRLYIDSVKNLLLGNPRGGKLAFQLLTDLTFEPVVAKPEVPADAAEIGDLADTLREMAVKRARLRAWQYGAKAAADDNQDGADRALEALSKATTELQRVEYLETVEAIGYAYLGHKASRDAMGQRQRTGFDLIDQAIGDLKKKTLWVIGGTSGSGKSSLALSVAMRMAKSGVRGGWISFEDPESVVGDRLVAMELNIELPADRELSDFEHARLGKYIGSHGADKLIRFAFPLNLGPRELMNGIRECHEHGAKFVVVDYLQAIRQPAHLDRRNFIRDLVAEAKAECAARDMNLILLSQLSRPKDDPFAEPFNTRLKESGDIEDKAEVITLIWKTGDGDDARALAKMTKVKWSAKRPRGILVRNELGTITDFQRHEPPAEVAAPTPQKLRIPKSWDR